MQLKIEHARTLRFQGPHWKPETRHCASPTILGFLTIPVRPVVSVQLPLAWRVPIFLSQQQHFLLLPLAWSLMLQFAIKFLMHLTDTLVLDEYQHKFLSRHHYIWVLTLFFLSQFYYYYYYYLLHSLFLHHFVYILERSKFSLIGPY